VCDFWHLFALFLASRPCGSRNERQLVVVVILQNREAVIF
jgi:hypothetical protein